MSKVITFSRTFPAYHPKAGQYTHFVEQIWNSLGASYFDQVKGIDLSLSEDRKKHHTIRAGSRWKVGDKFSPRVWSGKPYRSKQIVIAPDIEVKKVWTFEMKQDDGMFVSVYVNGVKFNNPSTLDKLMILANNDGLNIKDMADWFESKPFTGQIICWNESVNY